MKINITYENDRGTPAPERMSLKGEKGSPKHGRFWEITVADPTPEVENLLKRFSGRVSAPEIARFTFLLEGIIGVKDPTSMDDWQRCGVEELEYARPSGFGNWPDSDLGQDWDGSKIELV